MSVYSNNRIKSPPYAVASHVKSFSVGLECQVWVDLYCGVGLKCREWGVIPKVVMPLSYK